MNKLERGFLNRHRIDVHVSQRHLVVRNDSSFLFGKKRPI